MIKKAALMLSFLVILALHALGQTGCRRESDGVLFQNQIIFSSDYNAYQAYSGDVSGFCLPEGISGSPCRIRIPLTNITYAGTYGSYSPLNCSLDGAVYVLILSSVLAVFWIKRKKTARLEKSS